MIKRLAYTFMLAILVLISAQAQKKYSVYAIGFYNQENLFDTQHDEGKNDYQFLPNGTYKWNELKYNSKLKNMSKALADMGTDVLPGVGCAVIGVSEIENAHVLTDLVSQPPLKERGFKYVHIEGPDRRGVDCAVLYNPSLFSVMDYKLIPYKTEASDSSFITRGFLIVDGTMANENISVIVCHLPSRWSGPSRREQGALQMRVLKDSILKVDPQRKVFIMGDMNDDPTDKSMTQYLKAKANIDEVGDGDMYNPWYNLLAKHGTGTLYYRGAWNLFDQIVVSPNLLVRDKKQKDYSTLKFWKNNIQRMPYLFQTDGQYKGTPKRTTAGGVWLNGYSDHLPVVVYLVKEQHK